MKKCPFCGADLADEAQFCLYCMTPLNEKEQILPAKRRPKGWLFALGGILILGIVILLLWPGAGNEPTDPVIQVTTMPTTATTFLTTGTTIPTTIPTTVPTTVTTMPSSSVTTMPTTVPTSAATTAPTTTTAPSSATTTITTTTKPTTTPYVTTTPSTMYGSDSAGVVYYYRMAKKGDWIYDNTYQVSDDHITITGVKVPSEDGVYRIPETINGKKVTFIDNYAFDGNNARIVYIPKTVLSILHFAFNRCPITDIYFTHSLRIHSNAFPASYDILTIHCPKETKTCGGSGVLYSEYAYTYSRASWEEWNGEA